MDAKCNCRTLMKRIRETDFALVETVLFLNSHPESKEALAYYHELKKKNEALRAEYNSSCGPLTAYSNECENEWKWVKMPWPWELDSD